MNEVSDYTNLTLNGDILEITVTDVTVTGRISPLAKDMAPP